MMVKIEKGAFHLYLFSFNFSFICGGHDPLAYFQLLDHHRYMRTNSLVLYLKCEITKRLPTLYAVNAAQLVWTQRAKQLSSAK